MKAAWVGLLLLAAMAPGPSHAHDSLPIALSLDQTGAREYSLRARFPPSFPPGLEPQPGVTRPCNVARRQGDALAVRCPDGSPPAALTLAFAGPATNAPILLRLSLTDGQRRTIVSPPGTSRIDLPARQDRASVFAAYLKAGFDHIASGYDHLLFLVCLLLIAARPARIAWTVTGFTLGHALTIGLAASGLVTADARAVEVLIALSIVFAAAEIARGSSDSLTWRRPAVVAALFGLLHGLGFAGALAEIGLPQGEVVPALISFNLGIEAGQLLFVFALFFLARLCTRVLPSTPGATPARTFVAWPIGIIASLWFFMRLASV